MPDRLTLVLWLQLATGWHSLPPASSFSSGLACRQSPSSSAVSESLDGWHTSQKSCLPLLLLSFTFSLTATASFTNFSFLQLLPHNLVCSALSFYWQWRGGGAGSHHGFQTCTWPIKSLSLVKKTKNKTSVFFIGYTWCQYQWVEEKHTFL